MAASVKRLLVIAASECDPKNPLVKLAKDKGALIEFKAITRTKDYCWRRYLPRGKSKRGCRGSKGGSSASFIEGRVSVAKRPPGLASPRSIVRYATSTPIDSW